jgi:hypothetical protein
VEEFLRPHLAGRARRVKGGWANADQPCAKRCIEQRVEVARISFNREFHFAGETR